MKKVLIGLAIASLIMESGCSVSDSQYAKVDAVRYEKNTLYDYITIDGTLENKNRSTRVSTNLTDINVTDVLCNVGDYVKKGDVICRLDSSSFEKELHELEENANQSKTLSDYKYEQSLKKIETTKKENETRITNVQAKIDEAQRNYSDSLERYNNNSSLYDQYLQQALDCIDQSSAVSDQSSAVSDQSSAVSDQSSAVSDQSSAVSDEPPAVSDEPSAGSDESGDTYGQYEYYMELASNCFNTYEQAFVEMKEYQHDIETAKIEYKETELSNSQKLETAMLESAICKLNAGDSSGVLSRINELKKSIESCIITAPVDGVVTSVTADAGTNCEDGQLMMIQDYSEMQVHILIQEKDFLSLSEGMLVDVTLNTDTKKTYKGTIEKIVYFKSDGGFDGYINITDKDDSFILGVGASVKICTLEKKDVLCVNTSALFKNDNGEDVVYKAEQNDDDVCYAKEVKVDVITKTDDKTEIKSSELKENDIIVLYPDECSESSLFIPELRDDDENG